MPPTPRHFEQASELVTKDMVTGTVPCGPHPERIVESLRQYADAGYDEVYVSQIGPEQDAFFEAWTERVLPECTRQAVDLT